MQFQCDEVRYFRSCSKFIAPRCNFCNKIRQKTTVPPLHSYFWRAKMVEKTKQTQKSKNTCWTVEEEELLVELCQTANVFIKQTVQSLKKWTNGNPPVKILGEDLKQSLKAHLRFHPYLRETKNLSITFALVFMSKFNCNCR